MIKRTHGGQSRLSFEEVLGRAIEIMGRDKALTWWMTPLAYFDNQSPYKFCSNNKSRTVMRWLDIIDSSD